MLNAGTYRFFIHLMENTSLILPAFVKQISWSAFTADCYKHIYAQIHNKRLIAEEL